MKRLRKIHNSVLVLSLLAMILLRPVQSFAQDSDSNVNLPEGVYIQLTKDFYDSLKEEGQVEEKVYTNDPSIEYLRQISISARYMVETNIKILKQQEKILQMLHSFLDKKKK